MKIVSKVKTVIKFYFNSLRSLLDLNKRYIRLTPFYRGKIYFYDRERKCFFCIFVRERVDSGTADQVFTNDDYDLKFLKRYDELLEKYNNILAQSKIPLIIDCGANIGCSTIHFATTFPNSIVVAVEPENNNFLMMEKNCKDLNNIRLLNNAIGSANGFVSIDDVESDNNAFRTNLNDNKGDIEMLSINTILSSHNEFIPFVVKIDIEGFEEDLFSRNTEWVEKFPLLIIETHDWMLPRQANSHNFLKVISEQHRDFIHKGENIFSISNI